MPESKENRQFLWTSYDDTMSFPLDYSQDELAKLWGINRSHIAKHIVDNRNFRDFFLWMRYCNGEENPNDPYTKKGIPSELEPFFRIYLEETRRFRKAYKDPKSPEFIEELCRVLHTKAISREILAEIDDWIAMLMDYSRTELHANMQIQMTDTVNEESGSDERYWYRRLYENKAFQEAVSKFYWDKEYDKRCALLKELSIKMPYEVQIEQLRRSICNMDVQIGEMMRIIQRNGEQQPDQGVTEDFLKTFPQYLLEHLRTRVPSRKEGKGRTSYWVNDIKVKIPASSGEDEQGIEMTLKESFSCIRSTSDSLAIRKAIRPHYLKDVCKVPARSPFLQACLKLNQYLGCYTDKNKTTEEIRRFIDVRCKRYYQSIVWHQPALPGVILPGANWNSGENIVIDQMISSLYSEFVLRLKNQIDTIIAFSQRTSEQQAAYCQNLFASAVGLGYTVDQIYKYYSGAFSSLIKSMGCISLMEDIAVLDNVLSEDAIERLSSRMLELSLQACAAFNMKVFDWMTQDNFVKMWRRYNQILTTFDESIVLAGGAEEDVQLLNAMLICKVFDEYQHISEEVYGCYVALADLWGKNTGGSPEVTHQSADVMQADLKQSDGCRSRT